MKLETLVRQGRPCSTRNVSRAARRRFRGACLALLALTILAAAAFVASA